MWKRSELKARGKINFKRCYWKCVLICFITFILAGGLNSGTVSNSVNNVTDSISNNYYDDNEYYDEELQLMPEVDNFISSGFFALFGGLIVIVGIIGFVIKLLIVYPIEVGKNNFFMGIREEDSSLDSLICVYKSGKLKNTIITMFLKGLFQGLWTLLLVIPGIVKYYEYRMIPYILSENPSISRQRAFEISKDMMRGNKWSAFILDLSFLGWEILSLLTLGILGIFYVNPYVQSTNAELYAFLREDALIKGYASNNELVGF
ncbi:MAG: DUF975 family protein [Terrisporobacter sp.]